MPTPKPIVLYDGVCNLCSGVVKFIIDRDKKGDINFASLQSSTGHQYLKHFNLNSETFDTFVFIKKDKAYTRSTAALKLFQALGFPWSLTYILILIPRPVRDFVYKWISRNRYSWFGKKDSCMIPDENIRKRFLDWGEKIG